MNMNNTMQSLYAILCLASSTLFSGYHAYSQIVEGFDNITTLPASGWVLQNNSIPVGTIGWFQGNPDAFPAFNGATNSYIGANFNSVNTVGTISNWLITPNVTLKNGDVFSFYTRTSADNQWADRLQVRMSTNGTSADVGTTATSVGDFTTMLLEINPNLQLSVYPMTWTAYTITISGLAAPTSGRLAFRYFVTNGGSSGTNSDYIGIDNFVYTPFVCPTLTISPATLNQAYAGVTFNQALSQTGGQGSASYAVTSGTLPGGLNLMSNGTLSGTPSATGTFNFTVTVTDANGCEGTRNYTMEVLCNPNGASLNNLPSLCSNSGVQTLNQGLPAGGTYSGTGVTGNQFDPASGTQTITYTVNDAFGCLQTATGTITVNSAPQVALAPFSNICFNAPPIVLTGGTPAGGTYSGTSVNGGIFTPNAVGEFTITYTFTDANNCSASASQPLRVENCASLDYFGKDKITIYPNPSTGFFSIDLGTQNEDLREIAIYNAVGQLVLSEKVNLAIQNSIHSVDASILGKGVYLIELRGVQNSGVSRIIIE